MCEEFAGARVILNDRSVGEHRWTENELSDETMSGWKQVIPRRPGYSELDDTSGMPAHVISHKKKRTTQTVNANRAFIIARFGGQTMICKGRTCCTRPCYAAANFHTFTLSLKWTLVQG